MGHPEAFMRSALTTFAVAAIACGAPDARAAGFTSTSPTITPGAMLAAAQVGFMINANRLGSASFTARDSRK